MQHAYMMHLLIINLMAKHVFINIHNLHQILFLKYIRIDHLKFDIMVNIEIYHFVQDIVNVQYNKCKNGIMIK
jgi:hypothetical protein